MTACTHGGAAMRLTPGTRCPYCTTIVPADAPPTAGTRGAVSLEGTATREGSRPATIATGVAPHRERAGTVLLPCAPTTAPVATIADPAPATSTLCPSSAGGTHGANARPGAGSALNERREGHHAPKPCGLDADGALQGEPVQSAPSGDAAYMVILQVLSDRPTSEHLAGLSVRVAHDFVSHGYEGYQLHPKDTPGMFLELGRQLGEDRYDPHGAWMPSGPDGPASRRSTVAHAMTAVEIAVEDPVVAAAPLARLNGTDPVPQASTEGAVAVELENAVLRFVPMAADGRVGVRTVELAVSEGVAPVTIAGVRFDPRRSL